MRREERREKLRRRESKDHPRSPATTPLNTDPRG
jgi:hypothetical protein